MAVIAASLIGLTVVAIVMGSIGNLTGSTSADSDTEQLTGLAEVASTKCQSAAEGAVMEETVEYKIRSVRKLRLAKGSDSSSLELVFKEGDSHQVNLNNYCKYNLEGGPVDTTKAIIWQFTVNAESGKPPTVTISGSPK